MDLNKNHPTPYLLITSPSSYESTHKFIFDGSKRTFLFYFPQRIVPDFRPIYSQTSFLSFVIEQKNIKLHLISSTMYPENFKLIVWLVMHSVQLWRSHRLAGKQSLSNEN